MKIKNLIAILLLSILAINAALLTANAQYIDTKGGGDQILVNQPYNPANNRIVAPASMMPAANAAPSNAAPVEAGYAPNANFAQQPYAYTNPYMAQGYGYGAPATCGGPMIPATACDTPVATCGVPLATPCVAPCAAPVAAVAPFTSGYTYSANQASAFGPFTPPVSQASEQFYQYPGLTPYGAYPGAGYAATGGVGLDPMTGYYGPYGAYTPLY